MFRIDVPVKQVESRPREEPVADRLNDASASRESSGTSSVTSRRRPSSKNAQLWLRRTDQLLLGFLLIALLTLLMAFRWKLSGGWRTPIEIASQQPREYFYAIDVNNASWVQWAQLDGIGEKLARRIVKDRDDHGAFRSIDDLRRVKGIGPKLIEKLRPFLSCAAQDANGTRPN